MKLKVLIILTCLGLAACKKPPINPDASALLLYYQDSSAKNINHTRYLALLERGRLMGLPGISLLVHDDVNGLWTGATGAADIEQNIKMSQANLFRLASITKTFISTAVLQLSESGKINLDDPISKYLPAEYTKDLANAGNTSIRQVLNHTSGIFNFNKNPNYKLAVINDPFHVWTSLEKIDYARNQDPYFSTGDGWHYSNTNFLLLGELINQVSGLNYDAHIRKNIFDPLQMKHTYFGTENRYPEGLTKSYTDMYGNETIRECTVMDAGVFGPEGGMISTSYDLMLFIRALYTNKVLKPETLQEMMKMVPCVFPQSYYTHYGLGLMNWITPGGEGFGHGGSLTGFSTEMFYFPDKKTTIVVLVNIGILGESPLNDRYQDFLVDLAATVFK